MQSVDRLPHFRGRRALLVSRDRRDFKSIRNSHPTVVVEFSVKFFVGFEIEPESRDGKCAIAHSFNQDYINAIFRSRTKLNFAISQSTAGWEIDGSIARSREKCKQAIVRSPIETLEHSTWVNLSLPNSSLVRVSGSGRRCGTS